MEMGLLQRDGWRICHALGIPLQHRHIDRGQEESQIRAYQTERLTLSLLHIPHGGESAHKIYIEAVPDVMNYILRILDSTSYVDPPTIANNNILYYQLYEKLKMIM